MATIVSQIHANLLTNVSTSLGASYHRLKFVYNLESNDFRSLDKGYGVTHGAASSAETLIRSYTMDQDFEILLTQRAVVRDNDDDIQTAINDLYDEADKIFKLIVDTKIDLPSIVLVINNPSLGTPEILDNQLVLLRMGVNVKYRQNL